MDLQALIPSWFRGKGKDRFETGPWPQQVFSPYDIPTALIDDMIARNVRPWTVQTINLSVAGNLVLEIPGFHFVIFGHDNSSNKAVNTTALVNVFWGKTRNATEGFPAKHARGISGPFQALYLEWPAQNNVYADIVIYAGMFNPYIDGESCT